MTTARYDGRAGRVCRYLAAHQSGVTLRTLITAVAPDCKRNNMWGTLTTLEAQGKARRELKDGVAHFFPTSTTLVDGRVAANAAKREKPRATPAKGASRTSRAGRPAETASPAHVPVASGLVACAPQRSSLSALFTSVEAKRPDRDQLAADLAAFEARGGIIQRLGPGDTGESIRAQEAKFRAERRRRSEIPQHRRAKQRAA